MSPGALLAWVYPRPSTDSGFSGSYGLRFPIRCLGKVCRVDGPMIQACTLPTMDDTDRIRELLLRARELEQEAERYRAAAWRLIRLLIVGGPR